MRWRLKIAGMLDAACSVTVFTGQAETHVITRLVTNVARFLAPVHIILSLPCGVQKTQHPPRETVLGNHR
jgi:hypothetical protein